MRTIALVVVLAGCGDPPSRSARPPLAAPDVVPAMHLPTTLATDPVADACLPATTGAWPHPVDLSRLGRFDETTAVAPMLAYGTAPAPTSAPPSEDDPTPCTNPSPVVIDPTSEACTITQFFMGGVLRTTQRAFDASGRVVRTVSVDYEGVTETKDFYGDGTIRSDVIVDVDGSADVKLRFVDPGGRLLRSEERVFDSGGTASRLDGTEYFYKCNGTIALVDGYSSSDYAWEAAYSTASTGRSYSWQEGTSKDAAGAALASGGVDYYADGAIKAISRSTPALCGAYDMKTYDACGRILAEQAGDCHTFGGTTYEYSADGLLIVQDFESEDDGSDTRTFTYDASRRLATVDELMVYACPRTGCGKNGPNKVHLSTTYRYDAAGDLVEIDSTDAPTWTATYDAQHRRLSEQQDLTTILYGYGDCVVSSP